MAQTKLDTPKEEFKDVTPSLISVFFIVSIVLFGYIIITDITTSTICDIGERNITGDFKVINTETGLEVNYFIKKRYCAAEDCDAFNDWYGVNVRVN